MSSHDSVNSPDYYKVAGIEVKDIISDIWPGFYVGNALKYIIRAGRKDGASYIEDIRKAHRNLTYFIEDREAVTGQTVTGGGSEDGASVPHNRRDWEPVVTGEQKRF